MATCEARNKLISGLLVLAAVAVGSFSGAMMGFFGAYQESRSVFCSESLQPFYYIATLSLGFLGLFAGGIYFALRINFDRESSARDRRNKRVEVLIMTLQDVEKYSFQLLLKSYSTSAEHESIACYLQGAFDQISTLLESDTLLSCFDSSDRESVLALISAMDADDDSKAKAIEIINIFGERGDYSWRPLLNKLKE